MRIRRRVASRIGAVLSPASGAALHVALVRQLRPLPDRPDRDVRCQRASTGWPIASHIFRTWRLRPSRIVMRSVAVRLSRRQRLIRPVRSAGPRSTTPLREPVEIVRVGHAEHARFVHARRRRGADASAARRDRRRWSGSAALRSRSRAGRPDRRTRARRRSRSITVGRCCGSDRVVT